MGISQSTRFRILRRDRFACVYCGHGAGEVRLEVDHRLPVSQGGDDTDENLSTSCYDCNRGKRATVVSEILPPLLRTVLEIRAHLSARFPGACDPSEVALLSSALARGRSVEALTALARSARTYGAWHFDMVHLICQ